MVQNNIPKKRNYRQRAHCNPLSDSYLDFPLNTKYVDWHTVFPYIKKLNNINTFKNDEKIENNINNNNKKQLFLNTKKYPMNYNKLILKEFSKKIDFLDIGCGYGGLIIELSKMFSDKLILGFEIRDKITDYVGEKINALRNNNINMYQNVSIIRTNVLKFLPNYIEKEQIEKLFFCFPDPHFKRHNWRRRIINIENLPLYNYILKKGGLIYFITDVYSLYIWVINCFLMYEPFQILEPEHYKNDLCIKLMQECTEESKKVKAKGHRMYYCIVKKK